MSKGASFENPWASQRESHQRRQREIRNNDMLVLARQSEGNFTGMHDAGFAVLCASMVERTHESTIDLCVRLSHECDVGFLQVGIPQTSLHKQLEIHSSPRWHTSPFGSKEQLIMPYELSRVNTGEPHPSGGSLPAAPSTTENRTPKGILFSVLVGLPGVEPGLHDPQPCVIPLYHSPK